MKTIFYYLFFAAFFYLPLAILLIRAKWPKRMPWWKAVVLVALLGWAFTIGLVVTDDISTGEPAASNGVTALLAGWAQSLIWFVPWVVAYKCLRYCRGLSAK